MTVTSQHLCPACQAINRIPVGKHNAGPRCGKCKQALFTGEPIDVNQSQFERFLQKEEAPLLVDFWAPWCGPCKMMAPAFAQAAAELGSSVRCLKVNTETEQALGARFNIRSIPTLMIFKDQKELKRQAGAMEQSAIVRWAKSN